MKVDGSGRLSLRNRKFLRKFTLPTSPLRNIPQISQPFGEAVAECPVNRPLGITSPPPPRNHIEHYAPVDVGAEVVPLVPKMPVTPDRHTSTVDEPVGHRAVDVAPEIRGKDPAAVHPDIVPNRLLSGGPKPPQDPCRRPSTERGVAASRPVRQRHRPKVYSPEDGTWS